MAILPASSLRLALSEQTLIDRPRCQNGGRTRGLLAVSLFQYTVFPYYNMGTV